MLRASRTMRPQLWPTSFETPASRAPQDEGFECYDAVAIARRSAVIRKDLDRIVEAADRIFADAFESEIAFDGVGERAGQQHRSAQLLGERFETRSHVDRRPDDGEVEPGA